MNKLVALGVTTVAGLSLTACGFGGVGGGGNSTPTSTADATTTTVAPPTSLAQSAIPNLPAAQTLDLQANHPNGTVVRLTGASFHDDHIKVQASVTNGNDRETRLNDFDLLLRDDQGVVYRLAPPSSNPKLSVQARSSANFDLVFLGRVNPRATNLTFSSNDRVGNLDSQFTSTPTIRLSPIPVQR